MQQDKRWAGAGLPVGDAQPSDLDIVRGALRFGVGRAVAGSSDSSERPTLRGDQRLASGRLSDHRVESKQSRVPDSQAERAHLRIESRRFLEVADVPSSGNDRQPCTGDRVAYLVRDGQW